MECPMGQKVSPIGFRLGINKTWDSKWYREAGYAEWLNEDMAMRAYINRTFKSAGIAKVDIERAANARSVFMLLALVLLSVKKALVLSN